MHLSAGVVSSLFLCLTVMAQANNPITLQLSLGEDRHVYKAGEPISLSLTFTASEPGLSLNITTTEPASPVDTLVLSPMTGVFPWLDDQARNKRYSPDYSALASLEVGKPETVTLTLNAVYRFDAPGHYRVQLVTARVLRGDVMHSEPLGPIESNLVDFDIEPMDQKEEADRAARLEQQIRQATDMRRAQEYAEELDWLAGDASTRVKLSLFLYPKTFYPIGIDVSRGLWIARNRALVVTELERALRDSSQSLSVGSSLLQITVALKAHLESPFDPADPGKHVPAQQVEEEYLKQIAAALPQRKDDALVTAAITVFVQLAQRKEIGRPEFAAAREVVITHFDEVNEFNVDWLLNSFGQYLEDGRIVPSIKHILKTQHNPIFNGERTAALRQLMKITSGDSRDELVVEVCDDNPTLLQILDEVPFKILPETDDCLKRKIHAAVDSAKSPNLNLQWASEFAARFATSAIYDDLLTLYMKAESGWDKQAKGYMLGYLVRWDSSRGTPLLERALPASSPELDFSIAYALNRVYSPALELFWRRRLAGAPPGQAEQAAWQLSEHGPAEDQALIRTHLETWRAAWKRREIPDAEGRLERQLLEGVIRGKNWQTPESETSVLRDSCLSTPCKSFFSIHR